MTDIKFITEQDETGLGRIVVDGRFYGVPAKALAILSIERERNRAAIGELLRSLKYCAGVIAGENLNKSALINALEEARAAITKHDTSSTTTKETA